MCRTLQATIAIAATVIATTSMITAASAAPSATNSLQCGYFVDNLGRDAKYRHCGDTRVKIWVDYISHKDDYFCTSAGVTNWVYYLGTTKVVQNAWYIGLC
ncbi:DUF6355 family natural product biosynthesis protein [Allokutzneria oryzae]|uniref:DUF6355 family natural product biosynthesis protein n=1 Tax=Allokutzneria oryzae TaxID=1378989 RepID=A0ABV5ZTG5_9PSEU